MLSFRVVDWSTFLKITHIIGTVLGAGGATFAEFQLREAARSGGVNRAEGKLLSLVYWLIRVGLILIVFSGFGFFLRLRLEPGLSFVLYEPRMWMKLLITGLLVTNAFMLHVRRIPLWLGAAVSLTGWYAALVLGAWRGLEAGFLLQLIVFMAVLTAVTWLMRYLHERPQPAAEGKKT